MKRVGFSEHRSSICSGDLLLWGESAHSLWKNTVLNFVRLMTWSKYGHVGIAARKGGDPVCIIEAVMPEVRLAPLIYTGKFYHIPMYLDWNTEAESFIFDKIGLGYSIMDCIRAYFGITVETDDSWQCAELANEFYKCFNLDFKEAFTPKTVADTATKLRNTEVFKIVRP